MKPWTIDFLTTSVIITLPIYARIALAEIFSFLTGNEYPYKQAPKDVKSVIQSIYALKSYQIH